MLRRIQRDMINASYWSSCEVSVFVARF